MARYIRSDESITFELTFPTAATRIIKFDQPGQSFVHREQVAFPALRDMGFPEFPEIEYTQDDLPSIEVVFNIMPKAPSVTFTELWERDRRALHSVVARMGDFLRRLASVDWKLVPGAVPPMQRTEEFSDWFARWWAPLRDAGVLSAEFHDSLLAMLAASPSDFGNWAGGDVLTDGTSFTAIDWANIGAFWSLCDLASKCGFDHIGADAQAALLPVLLDAYTAGVGLNDGQVAELSRWQAFWALFDAGAALHGGDQRSAEGHVSAATRLWISAA